MLRASLKGLHPRIEELLVEAGIAPQRAEEIGLEQFCALARIAPRRVDRYSPDALSAALLSASFSLRGRVGLPPSAARARGAGPGAGGRRGARPHGIGGGARARRFGHGPAPTGQQPGRRSSRRRGSDWVRSSAMTGAGQQQGRIGSSISTGLRTGRGLTVVAAIDGHPRSSRR